ncbi:histidine kinase [Aeromonas rivipollensis]|uniref:Histidine kinase n=1 Tax=Aeromonas rivipollensis TaxID=948519 RepID=A0ABX0CWB9_9GAMM|nr:ATP-binding protein [Aeromonas rivipollensis]NEX88216.1 histidine kinase [Aeromonas rivipollensis]NEY07031.1 histidine kinase [Aeromonas rivipollensis]
MQSGTLTFRARARTIEHLGKGQIADCPTAVSELWKNAYDAYARDVVLYTIDSKYPCGGLIDNGCGMTLDQLVDSWLIVGTESKSKKSPLCSHDRFGLRIRKTQGEKGIGRLSAAFLSSVTFLVTKKIDSTFTAILVDWRLFENPYLSFDDIKIPVGQFSEFNDIELTFNSLVQQLNENVYFHNNKKDDLVERAWSRYSKDEFELAEHPEEFISTQDKIINFCTSVKFDKNLVLPWSDVLKKVADIDGDIHGTALFLFDLGRELSLLTNSSDLAKDNIELTDIQKDLVDTLRGFVNPLTSHDDSFSYQIHSIRNDGRERSILSQFDVFGKAEFDSLEHTVVGSVDEKGWFRGKIKAFGEDKGDVVIPPSISVDSSGVGPFQVHLGTFEMLLQNTVHPEREHSNLLEKAQRYSGLMVFRDGLRVLPYGRVDNDFFQIEERRSLNAGRYYWSNRRLFGYIGISQDKNKQLKDKSGREGFIRNQAARQLRVIVSDLLITLADRFFGKHSEDRQEILSINKREKEQRKSAQQNARKATQKGFSEALKKQAPLLDEYFSKAVSLKHELESSRSNDIHFIEEADTLLSELDAVRIDIRTPIKPPKIGIYEDKYRSYRDKYNEFSQYVTQLKTTLNKLNSDLNKLEPTQLVKRHLERNQGVLNSRLSKYSSAIQSKIDALTENWNSDIKSDRAIYYRDAISVLEVVENGGEVEIALNSLDSIYLSLLENFSLKYQSIIKALERIAEGINLESAFSLSEEERDYLEEKTKSLNALAQLGISVEIISHELEDTDSLVTRGLSSLPSNIKEHPGFQLAFNAHKSLTEQIRFLSPLKLSGYQARQKITGKNISEHIIKFFGDRFSRQRVDLFFGREFLSMNITDVPSRIYPVFTNIVNNALYWVCFSDKREIKIDLIDNLVLIANSGPKVDEDDIQKLFSLFYSKRANGHGVGLYLCRENLSVAHHKIWYADIDAEEPYLIKNGANFIIEFNGMERVNG